MLSTINKILEGFPFPRIALIVGPPNFETISELHMKLNSNVASIQSNLGDSALDLLYLAVSQTIYTTLSTPPFIVSVIPGSEPIIPNGSTGSNIADLRYAFQLANYILTEYNWTDKALHQILLASFDKLYVWSLCHCYIRYGQTTTCQLLDHLYAVYANISPSDLQINNAKLCTP